VLGIVYRCSRYFGDSIRLRQIDGDGVPQEYSLWYHRLYNTLKT
jgi:hypothetical protein